MGPNGLQYADLIDGKTEDKWNLPLEPLNSASFEPYPPGESPELDRHLAGERVIENHEAVVKFGLRSMGKPGRPPMRARLCDPNALPNLDYMEQTDIIFRHVANALINGPDKAKFSVSKSKSNYLLNFDFN